MSGQICGDEQTEECEDSGRTNCLNNTLPRELNTLNSDSSHRIEWLELEEAL